ncbi:exportin-5 isoform X2 [Callorhinchus milii]|uniref:exportin-5 isoform X2 n=1 Tax=Callorhinchus milii TaxID=7868 RepID=UPI001C3FDBEB|nr:exportin-5 isoform X2 [Callorhinchus milii]
MSGEQITTLCEQLMKAVNVIMDGGSSSRYRLEALKFCEEFKEKCPQTVQCGLRLAEKNNTGIVRHFGLQILEHSIKFRWNGMVQREKVQLKNSVMTLLSRGTHNIMVEEAYIKDALSRIVVEMIKREWPQQWPDMLNEMDKLTAMGETQTELVMLILLRLVEDVVTFQTIPAQRRKDIQHALTQNMSQLFGFLLDILQEHTQNYKQLKADATQENKAKSHCRVAITTLSTMAGYVDWVGLHHLTADGCKLLEVLCMLLTEPEFQFEAAECLLIAVIRKGKLEDRKPFMVLFSDAAMHCILSAAQTAHGAGLVEQHYMFLKRLCQLLTALGGQLTALWGGEKDIGQPPNFSKYLQAFLAFTNHPSQYLRSSTQIAWCSFLRHEYISKDSVMLEIIPQLLHATMANLLKVGFPSKTDSASCEYSRVDFDNDEDFNAFFNSFRAQQGETIRLSCRLAPMTGFNMASEALQYQLTAAIDVGPTMSKTGTGLCSIFSPSFVQWDALTFFMESVMSQLFRTLDAEQLPVAEGVELLKAVLSYHTHDPLILSCILTAVSTLCPFLLHDASVLPQVLEKLFASATFEVIEESQAPRTRAVKNVRRHACSSILKMCRDHPELIMPVFDMFYTHVKRLQQDERQLTQLEKCALMESLVLLSNQFKNYERQKAFLEELMCPVTSLWLSEEMHRVLSEPGLFLAYIGADVTPADPIMEDPSGINRSRISLCVYTILGVVKRARWPSDLEEAKAGGFVVGFTPSGAPMYRNACTEHVIKLLDNLLALIRTHNNLWQPEVMEQLSPHFRRAHDMLEVEKNAILGNSLQVEMRDERHKAMAPLEKCVAASSLTLNFCIPQPLLDHADAPVYKSVLERMQGFFCTLYDNCFHILGNAGPSMLQDFFNVNNFAESVINSAFVNLENIADYRLRPVLRVFVKPLVQSCPPEHYESVLCPILGPLFSYLLQRLSAKWIVINQRGLLEAESGDAEENPESQEMLEEQLTRLLTRESIDLMICCCVKRGPEPFCGDMEDDEMMSTNDGPHTGAEELTELGKSLLKSEEFCKTLLVTAYSAISWNDTITCQRATLQLCWPLIKQVTLSNLHSDAASWFLMSVLRGLQMHGQHEGCLAALVNLAFLIYEAMRPRHPDIKTVMQQIPHISIDALEQFDQKLLNPSSHKMGDKRRKDLFKKLLSGCIGKPLGQKFKKEVHIKNLPSLFKKPKPQTPPTPIEEEAAEDNGLASLFDPRVQDM